MLSGYQRILAVAVVLVSLLYVYLDELSYTLTRIPSFEDATLSKMYREPDIMQIINEFTSLKNEMAITDDEMHFFYENGYLIYRNVIPLEIVDMFSIYVDRVFENPPLLYKILKYFGRSIDQIPYIHNAIADDEFEHIITNLPWMTLMSKLLENTNNLTALTDSSLGVGDVHFHITDPAKKKFVGLGGKQKTADGFGSWHAAVMLTPFQSKLKKYVDGGETYSFFTGNGMSVWIPLDETGYELENENSNENELKYTLQVYPRSHLLNNDSESKSICGLAQKLDDDKFDNKRSNEIMDVKLNRGDVVIFIDSFLHRGRQHNLSFINRRMTVRYTTPSTIGCRGMNYLPYYTRFCPTTMEHPDTMQHLCETFKKCNNSDMINLVNGKRVKRLSPKQQTCLPRVKDWFHYLYQEWTTDFVACYQY